MTVANGSVGAGAAGASLTYQESVSFTQNGGIFGLTPAGLKRDHLRAGHSSAQSYMVLITREETMIGT